MMMTGDDV